MSRFQRILLIITFVVVTVMLGLLLYAAFFSPRVSRVGNSAMGTGTFDGTTPGTGLDGTSARLPGTSPSPAEPTTEITPRPSPVSLIASGGTIRAELAFDANARNLTLDRDGTSLLYYDGNDGRFYRVGPDGAARPLTDRVFHSVEQITWSADRQRAVLEYPDGANIIYEFGSGRQFTLPKHWEEFSFAPDSNQIIAKSIGLDQDNRFLVVSDSSGARIRPVASIGANADSIIPSWSPSGQIVAMQVENSGSERQEIFFVGLNDEHFPSTVVPGWGFEGNWTPDGRQLLYSVYSGQNGNRPELWLVEASPTNVGANRRTVGLQTWAHKCTFADASVAYCAVPQSLPAGAGLFPVEMDNQADSLYRVDLARGNTTLVATPDRGQTMRSLQLSGDGRFLYYTARQDGKVYRLQLK